MVELRALDAWWTAGSFAIFSSLLTIYQIRKHLQWNTHKSLRKYIIRIIFMVPIYALESWLGLRFVHIAMYFDFLRECYEAFVIYSFYQLLVEYLGGESQLILLLARKPQVRHVIPFCCFKPWAMTDRIIEEGELNKYLNNNSIAAVADSSDTDLESSIIASDSAAIAAPIPVSAPNNNSSSATRFVVSRHHSSSQLNEQLFSHSHTSQFLLYTQIGTLQYCVLRPFTAVLAFLFELFDVYGEGEFHYNVAYPYLSFIINCSQIWAMYCLVLFYYALKDELKGLKPVPKFIVVKAVVFFTFWQFILLSILAKMGIIHDTENYTEDKLTAALQDFIVCIEMSIAAAAHHKAFDYMQFHDPSRPQIVQPMFKSMFEAIDVTDVYVSDVKRIKEKVSKRNSLNNNEVALEASGKKFQPANSLRRPLMEGNEFADSADNTSDNNGISMQSSSSFRNNRAFIDSL